MADYTIVGYRAVRLVLELVGPYVVAKRAQVHKALELLGSLNVALSEERLVRTAEAVDEFAKLNYSKRKKHDAGSVREYLSLKRVQSGISRHSSLHQGRTL
jgi:hypothetical protein